MHGEPLGHLEAVDVGQLHVEQHHVRTQLDCRIHRGQTVLRLAHDHVALELQKAPRGGPEPRVVVDDEDSCGHRRSLLAHTRFTKEDTL